MLFDTMDFNDYYMMTCNCNKKCFIYTNISKKIIVLKCATTRYICEDIDISKRNKIKIKFSRNKNKQCKFRLVINYDDNNNEINNHELVKN